MNEELEGRPGVRTQALPVLPADHERLYACVGAHHEWDLPASEGAGGSRAAALAHHHHARRTNLAKVRADKRTRGAGEKEGYGFGCYGHLLTTLLLIQLK